MIAKLQKEAASNNTPVLLVDGGNLFWKENKEAAEGKVAFGGYQWDVFQSIAKSYNIIGYQALVPGRGDLLAGNRFFTSEAVQKLPFISANVLYNGKAAFSPYKILTLPKQKQGSEEISVGVVGLSGGSTGEAGEYQLLPWQDTLKTYVAEVRHSVGENGLVILLSSASITTNEAIAKAFAEIDIIIGGDASQGDVTRLFTPQTIFSQSNSRGKSLGVMNLTLSVPLAEKWQDIGNIDREGLQCSLVEKEEKQVLLQKQLGAETDDKKRRRLEYRLQQLQEIIERVHTQLVAVMKDEQQLQNGVINGFFVQFRDIAPAVGDHRIIELLRELE